MIQIKKKEPVLEAVIYTGSNYEELKAFCPQLEKYNFEFRAMETVGFKTIDEHTFSEALPGFYIVNDNGQFIILSPEKFQERYEI